MIKKYTKLNDNGEIVQVEFDEVLADAVLRLIDSGIDEDTHLSYAWDIVDNDDLEMTINNPNMVQNMLNYLKTSLTNRLRDILADRKSDRRNETRIYAKNA